MAAAGTAKAARKIDYGIDAPGVIRNLAAIGLTCLAISFFIHNFRIGSIAFGSRSMFVSIAVIFLLEALLMYLYARYGKFPHRDRMLKRVGWTGGERVLDVGTGRGLLAIAAAKRAPRGEVIGVDIWSQEDLSANSIERTRENIEAEGVGGNCSVRDGDARKLAFADDAFDVIVSNLCLHNIPSKPERDAACGEIYRVLKPGGVAVISDFRKMNDYQAIFKSVQAAVEMTGRDFLRTFPPLRIMTVRKTAPAKPL